jgi:hypothetical protein
LPGPDLTWGFLGPDFEVEDGDSCDNFDLPFFFSAADGLVSGAIIKLL